MGSLTLGNVTIFFDDVSGFRRLFVQWPLI
jgi:hypothetical protein